MDSYKSIILPLTLFILVLPLDFPLINFHFRFKTYSFQKIRYEKQPLTDVTQPSLWQWDLPHQHGLQLLDLLLVLSQKGILLILVDLGFVLDVLGTVGITERAQGLIVVVVRGRQTGHHQSFGVASQ